jgi:uncharacterized protein (DUF1499 family)
MSETLLGKPRPLWQVILLSVATLMLYYGYYKWVIQDELRRYTGSGWSGAVSLVPFVLGIAIPQGLRLAGAPAAIGWLSLLGLAWIYIVQFRLYQTVNRLYAEAGMPQPLVAWWLFVPGLNLLVGFRQIHFLSQFWAQRRGTPSPDPIAQALPVFFASLLLAIGSWAGPAAALPLTPSPVLGLLHFAGSRPDNLGVQAGQLAVCPTTPNCVSSQGQDAAHTIAPLRYTSTPEAAFAKLKSIVQSLPRTQIVSATDTYLYAEFSSKLMGFVDDVEFSLDPSAPLIQVRSASRLGESDLGVNRDRVESIRSALGEG